MKLSTKMILASAGLLAGVRLSRLLMRESFNGKVVLITGGTRGLGLVLAREFAKQGAHLAVLARDDQEVSAAERELAALTHAAMGVVCDCTDADAVGEAVRMIHAKFGRLDVIVNDAGQIQVGPLQHMRPADFDAAYQVHVRAPLNVVYAAWGIMREQGGGRIVNIASIGGLVAVPHMAPYTTSKFALVGLSDALRAEMYRDNIRVTTVCPGLMRTGSHIKARFKGQVRREYTWFSWSDAMPFISIDAQRAARAIVEATRDGVSHLDLSLPTKMARVAQATMPGVVAQVARVAAVMLPNAARGCSPREISGQVMEKRGTPANLSRAADENNERNDAL